MIRRENCIKKEHVQGGDGEVYFYHVLTEEELYGHGRMYARVVLPAGSSIGWHQHIHETEPYYILSGTGIFVDNDGSRTEVHAGDVCTILPGQSHSIENRSDEDLVLMALIYKD